MTLILWPYFGGTALAGGFFFRENPTGLIGAAAAAVTFLIGNFVSNNGNGRRQPFFHKKKLQSLQKLNEKKERKQERKTKQNLDPADNSLPRLPNRFTSP